MKKKIDLMAKQVRSWVMEMIRFWWGIWKFFSSGFYITYYNGEYWSVMRIWYKGDLVIDLSPLGKDCVYGKWISSSQDETTGNLAKRYYPTDKNKVRILGNDK